MRELQDSIAKGSFVPESQLYQQAQRDIHAAREDVERQRLLINTLQQERAGLQSRQQNQELQVWTPNRHLRLCTPIIVMAAPEYILFDASG